MSQIEIFTIDNDQYYKADDVYTKTPHSFTVAQIIQEILLRKRISPMIPMYTPT